MVPHAEALSRLADIRLLLFLRHGRRVSGTGLQRLESVARSQPRWQVTRKGVAEEMAEGRPKVAMAGKGIGARLFERGVLQGPVVHDGPYPG